MISGLPEKLRALRKKHNYSQKNIADMLHVSPAIVSAYETGERTPSTENLLGLARIYHCTTDFLLGNDHNQVGFFIDIGDLNEKEIRVIQNIIELLRERMCQ